MCQYISGRQPKNGNQLNNNHNNINSDNFQSQESVKAEFVSSGDRIGYHEHINVMAQLVCFEAHFSSPFDDPNIIRMRGQSAKWVG